MFHLPASASIYPAPGQPGLGVQINSARSGRTTSENHSGVIQNIATRYYKHRATAQ